MDKETVLMTMEDDDDGSKSDPVLMLIMGGVGVGKSRHRREKYRGWVQLDAGDVFIGMCAGRDLDFPGPLEDPMNRIGRQLAYDTLAARRSLVVEIIGDVVDPVTTVIDSVTAMGYRVEVETLTLDVEEAWLNNVNRGPDNISAYYSQRYQMGWILEAVARIKSESRPEPSADGSRA